MSEPYIRHNLEATRAGIPDAAAEVAWWLDRLEDVLRDAGPAVTAEAPGPQEAYDWLALAAKLRRVRSELIEECGGVEELQRAWAKLDGHGAELARRALSVLNPRAWLEAAREFDRSLDDPLDEHAEIEGAVELIEDLDDAELVLAAAQRFGVEADELEAGVQDCVGWLCRHADVVLAASVYVQAVGMGMRPDLESQDYGLAATALKFVHLLDAAVAAEADLTLANVEPLPAAVVQGLIEHYSRERYGAAILAAAWLCRRLSAYRPTLATASSERELGVQRWVWTDPEGGTYARLVVPDPSVCGPDERTPLIFLRMSDDSPATELGGQKIRIGRLEATIEESANVPFTVGQLAEAGTALTLHVGVDRREWKLAESSVTVERESSG